MESTQRSCGVFRLEVSLEGSRGQVKGDKTLEAVEWDMVREFLQKQSWLPAGKWRSREAGGGSSLEAAAFV